MAWELTDRHVEAVRTMAHNAEKMSLRISGAIIRGTARITQAAHIFADQKAKPCYLDFDKRISSFERVFARILYTHQIINILLLPDFLQKMLHLFSPHIIPFVTQMHAIVLEILDYRITLCIDKKAIDI